MALNVYGLSEITGPGVAVECPERRGMHVAEDHFLPEVVDPKTLEPVPPGTTGELVLTTLSKQGMPLLRYRTRDLTSLDPAPCRCGRTLVRLEPHHGAVRRHADHPRRQRVPLAGGARAPPDAGARAALPPGGAARARPRHPRGAGGEPAGGGAAGGGRRPGRSPRASAAGSSSPSGCRSRSASWRRRRSSGAPARPSAFSTSAGRATDPGGQPAGAAPSWRSRWIASGETARPALPDRPPGVRRR